MLKRVSCFSYYTGSRDIYASLKDSKQIEKIPNLLRQLNRNTNVLDANQSLFDVLITVDDNFEDYISLMDQLHLNKDTKSFIKFNNVTFAPIDSHDRCFLRSNTNFHKSLIYAKIRELIEKNEDYEERTSEGKTLIISSKINKFTVNVNVGMIYTYLIWRLGLTPQDSDILLKEVQQLVLPHLTSLYDFYGLKKNFLMQKTLTIRKGINDDTFHGSDQLLQLLNEIGMVANADDYLDTGLVELDEQYLKDSPEIGKARNGIMHHSSTCRLQDILIAIVTWNLAGYLPKNSVAMEMIINKFKDIALVEKVDPQTNESNIIFKDVIVFNFQELIEMKLKADAVTEVGLRLFGLSFNTQFRKWITVLESAPFIRQNYVLIDKLELFGLGTTIWIKKELRNMAVPGFKTTLNFARKGIPEKGALIMCMKLLDTKILFANCHLPSGETVESKEKRVEKVKQLTKYIDTNANTPSKKDLRYDIMFWAGDFNLRTFNNIGEKRSKKGQIKLDQQTIVELREKDEVALFPTDHNYLSSYYTDSGINHDPSYKLLISELTNKYVPNRRPSWTDRIYYRVGNPLAGQYICHGTSTCHIPYSDHK